MPATLTYPGVYIEEIPSGVRTIVGVATSITAFIGRTRRGPVNEPKTINSFADFERVFGGLWELSPMSFAVRDFYLNGGSQAVIVRLYESSFPDDDARDAAFNSATTDAQDAADAVVQAATDEQSSNPDATAQEIASAAQAALGSVAATKSLAAQTAAQQVASAASAEAAQPPYMATDEVLQINGATNATTGDIKLKFDGEETGSLAFADLTDANAAAATDALKNQLNTLATIAAAGGIQSVGRSGSSPNFSFQITFAGPQALIEISENTLTGGATVTVSYPLPNAQSVVQAANDAVNDAVATAAGQAAPFDRARLLVDTLNLEAADPGAWGNQLRARVDYNVLPGAADLFNLIVRDGSTVPANIETFRNVSILANHKRNLTNVLEQGSKLVRTRGALPGARPAENESPAPGADPFEETTSSGVSRVASDGNNLTGANYTGIKASEANKTGMYALEKADLFNILCIPPYSFDEGDDVDVWADAASYCERRRAMLIIDAPGSWGDKDAAKAGIALGIGTTSKNSALFFPRLKQPNPLHDNQLETFAACGAVAGTWARTDAQRGVWKAPAGLEATLVGVPQLSVPLTDNENGELNPIAVNCLRAMPPAGRVVWGSRTLQGDDRLGSEWKYIPVRRLALYLEETLYRNTQWVVFEPNDEPLWAQIRLNIGAFMHTLFVQGAFQGQTPRDAYFVKCDKETTTQNDIDLGIVNIVVGFAPLKPAEFVVITIQQMAGQIQT